MNAELIYFTHNGERYAADFSKGVLWEDPPDLFHVEETEDGETLIPFSPSEYCDHNAPFIWGEAERELRAEADRANARMAEDEAVTKE